MESAKKNGHCREVAASEGSTVFPFSWPGVSISTDDRRNASVILRRVVGNFSP